MSSSLSFRQIGRLTAMYRDGGIETHYGPKNNTLRALAKQGLVAYTTPPDGVLTKKEKCWVLTPGGHTTAAQLESRRLNLSRTFAERS